jgi:hypothetical protein
MALGPTHFVWRPDVFAVILGIRRRFPGVTVNTYTAHPFQNGDDGNGWAWENVSFDVWGPGGRGDPIPYLTGRRVKRYVLNSSKTPPIRHWIWRHTLWTSFAGKSRWAADDHSGALRHLHVTCWL